LVLGYWFSTKIGVKGKENILKYLEESLSGLIFKQDPIWLYRKLYYISNIMSDYLMMYKK